MLTEEKVQQIFDETDSKWTGDNAYKGLSILAKYIDTEQKDILQAAEHDIIYGPEVEKCIEAGITEDDVKKLALLNWTIDVDCFACYV